MKQKLALVMVMLLMVSVIYVPVGYTAWADEHSVTEDFEGYTVAEGAFVAMDTATGSKWKQMNPGKYANSYLTKENGNTVAVIKDFDQKASAILDFFLTKKATENSVTKNIYDMADGGKDQLFREMMMRFQFYGDATNIIMQKGKSYTMSYDYKYTSGNTVLPDITNRAGFIFPKDLVSSFSGANFGSWPAVTALKKTDTQQIYGAGRDSVAKGNGWYNGGGTITFNKIWEKNDNFVYADASTHVELEETPLTFMAFEFKGMANFTSKNGIDSIWTMLTQSLADYMVELKANPTSTNLPSLKATALTNFTQNLEAADFRVYLDNVSFEEDFSDRLSLEENTVHYNNTVRTASPLQVKAYKLDGTSYDLTGNEEITYQSSDPSVFRFTSGNLLESTGRPGKSIITVTYKGASTSVVMINLPSSVGGNKMEAQMPAAYKTLAGGFPGHNDAQSYNPDPTSKEYASTSDIWALRLFSNRTENWFGKGYRNVGGWFYDDLTNPTGLYFAINDSLGYTTPTSEYVLCHPNLAQDYSYGAFDWTGKKSWGTGGRLEGKIGQTNYTFDSNSLGVPRTKGWHQALFTLEKNPSATWGWTGYYYVDGVVVKTVDVVPVETEKEPVIEMRGLAFYTPKQANNQYLIYPSYYDDFFLGGSLGRSTRLAFDVGSNGSVQINGIAKNNGDAVYVGKYDSVVITATPSEGYEIDTFTLDSTPLTPDANGSVSLSGVPADATLNVTYKSTATEENPDVSSDTSYNYFSNVSGTPTAYVYGKLNNFSGTSTDGYGMNVWIAGAPENSLQLPAMVAADQPAVATPNAAFVIKVFGDAIQADQSYVFQPYVGETTGDEIPVEFEE